MKRIIVPIDFSSMSLNGLDLAFLLAGNLKAKVEMVHVMKKDENKFFSEEKLKYSQVLDSLEDLVKKYSSRFPEIVPTYIIKEGKVYEEVVKQAESYEDSVIVVSTHGNSGWEELFIGSNAYKIISSSERPTFTIRGNKIPKQIKKIVLPIDITLESREKVPLTAMLSKILKAEIHVVTVNTSDLSDIQSKLNNYADQVCRYLSHHKIKNSFVQLHGDNITDITIDYANNVKADLISIMTEQEKKVSNILLGSYAHQMINKSTIPVLLFPTKQIGILTESFKTEGIDY